MEKFRRPKRPTYTRVQLELAVGDTVEVTRDGGEKEIRKVTSSPWQLGHGDWIVGLEGISGGYALERCRKVEA